MKKLLFEELAEGVVQDVKHDFGEAPPEELGRNLLTIEDARRWLLHPSNWFDSQLFTLKWDGVVPKISRHHALRLLQEPWDTGIFWVAVADQRDMRLGRRRHVDIIEEVGHE